MPQDDCRQSLDKKSQPPYRQLTQKLESSLVPLVLGGGPTLQGSSREHGHCPCSCAKRTGRRADPSGVFARTRALPVFLRKKNREAGRPFRGLRADTGTARVPAQKEQGGGPTLQGSSREHGLCPCSCAKGTGRRADPSGVFTRTRALPVFAAQKKEEPRRLGLLLVGFRQFWGVLEAGPSPVAAPATSVRSEDVLSMRLRAACGITLQRLTRPSNGVDRLYFTPVSAQDEHPRERMLIAQDP
jgi:hypothetical protein